MSITVYQRRTLGFTSTLNQALGTMALWHYEQHLGLCFNVFKMSVNLQTVLTKISLQPWPNHVVLGTTA